MVKIIGSFEVENWDHWKKGFDEHAEARLKVGIKTIYVVHVERVQSNHFVMDLIKVQNLLQLHTKLKKQKKYFFVLVNKLTTNLFAMVHTASND